MSNNEEILQAARNEKGHAEYDRDVLLHGDNKAANIAGIAAIALFLVKWFSQRQLEFGFAFIAFLISAIQLIMDGAKLRKPFRLVAGIIAALLGVFSLLLFFAEVFSK